MKMANLHIRKRRNGIRRIGKRGGNSNNFQHYFSIEARERERENDSPFCHKIISNQWHFDVNANETELKNVRHINKSTLKSSKISVLLNWRDSKKKKKRKQEKEILFVWQGWE